MQIVASAYRHGYRDDEIMHAFTNAVRYVEYEYDNEERLLIIGPGFDGSPLELVAVPADSPVRIIHADRLRPSRYDYLR